MGEAWSDWYALDYLEKTGNVVDAPGVADVLEGEYVSGGANLIRTEAIDCKVGTSNSDPGCPGDPSGTAGTGGYTYGDFGKIIGRPEVHADGEIWGQTLWDLRDAVGSDTAEMLVTRAMELSPGNPSFLDMRNSILAADVAAFGGANHATIWAVFAHRGMGYFAAAADGDDTRPVEDFQLPPTSSTFGKLLGKVTTDGGQPIDGAVVAFGGHSSGFADDIIGVTKQNGLYDIKKILVGSYPKVQVSAPGFDAVTQEFVVVDHHANHLDVALRRNWASLFGGGSIVSFNGPDYTPFGCGPTSAIDDSLGSGWGSDTDAGASTGLVQPKFIVVKLPGAVDVTEVKVDPANTCGDPGSSATRGYKLEASADGVTFTEVSKGVFYAANRNQLNTVALSGPLSGVQYLRFWMLNPQVPNLASGACTSAATCGSDPDDQSNVDAQCGPGKGNGFGGCTFMDMVELKVYGRLP
jgi:hypothetical protein